MDSALARLIKPHITEAYFWKQVREGLSNQTTHLCRIENTAGTGISDVNACSSGIEVWIELKVFKGMQLHFRNSQKAWITTRCNVGGRVFVLARKEDDIFLYDGGDVMDAVSNPVSERKSFFIRYEDLPKPLYWGIKPFKWDELRNKIFWH